MSTINVSGYNGIINNLTVNGTLTAGSISVAKPQKASMKSQTIMSTTSTSFVPTVLTITITPTSATSQILLSSSFTLISSGSTLGVNATFTRQIGSGTITDLSTGIAVGTVGYGFASMGGSSTVNQCAMTYIDSPNTTSAVTYAIYIGCAQAATTMYFGYGWRSGAIDSTWKPVSTLNALEIL